MKATLYRSTTSLTTVRAMAAAAPRFLIRAQYYTAQPQNRLHIGALNDLPLYSCKGRIALDEFPLWRPVVYYRRGYPWEEMPQHDAQYMVECPMTLSMLEGLSAKTETALVVYVPPTWNQHEWRCDELHPSADMCRRLWSIVQSSPPAGDACCDTLKLPRGGLILSDRDMLDRMGCTPRELSSIRRTTLTMYQFRRLWKIYPRVPPPNAILRRTYDAIMELPQFDGAYIAVGTALRHAHNHWYSQVKDLVRCGSVKLSDVLAMYYPTGCVPNFTKIEFDRAGSRASLREVTSLVAASPPYQERWESRRREIPRGALEPT